MSVACFRPYNQTFAQPVDMLVVATFGAGAGPGVTVFQLDDETDTSWTEVSGAQVNEPGQDVHEATFQTTTLGCFGFATYAPI